MLRVLVVEPADGRLSLAMASTALCKISSARDAESSWVALQDLAWDVILIDLDASGAEGLGLAGRIREKAGDRAVLIGVSHRNGWWEKRSVLDSGFDYLYLTCASDSFLQDFTRHYSETLRRSDCDS